MVLTSVSSNISEYLLDMEKKTQNVR